MPPKRRRKFHGLYYHSSPPKVFPMNGNTNSTKNSGRDDSISKEAFVVKPSSIRIWIHDKDVAKLTRVLWAGQGNRLRTEISTSPKVKKFLETVPYALNVIKEVHQAVVDNNLDELKSKTEPPVPASLITTKDSNGLTVMHKAAGLAHTRIVEYLLKIWPDGATDLDSTGKTPLHWAASAKNNTRCYNLLVQAGADEEALDYRMKVASYYKHKPNDIDRSFLTVVPDAPRVAHENHPDWSSLVDDMRKQPNSDLSPSNNNVISKDGSMFENGVNLLTTRSKANSIEDTSEPDDMDEGKDKLSIGEQAVMAAIEDERLYEQLQQEKDESLQLNGNEDYDDDMNENDDELVAMVTPPLTSNLEDNDENGNDQSEDGLNANPHIGKQENGEDDDNEEQGESIDGEDKQQQEEHQEDMDMGVNDKCEHSEERGEGDKDEQINRIEADENEDENVNEKQPESEVAVETDNKSENEEDNQDESITANEKVDEANNEVDETNNEVDEANNEVDAANNEVDAANNEVDAANNEVDEANEDVEKPMNENEPDKMETTDNESEEKKENLNDIDENEDKPIEKSEEEKIKLDDDDSSNDVSSKNTDGDNSTKLENNDDKKLDEDDDDQDQSENNSNKETTTKNHNTMESKGPKSVTPPSPALEYEGVVQGEADDNQVQSQSGGYFVNENDRIRSVIDSGDMEQLAALVLNGEGEKLLGARSPQPEIQAFLDNVKSYMNKIRKVHQASREGNLRDLQSALDRRKFAIAKDEISPNGASPLHVAAIFGHAGIIRYLGGRFPETTSAVDDNGRTALHYAATINDNGHFYNLLTNLGSNPKSLDKLGNSAEYYKDTEESKNVFSYRELLKAFGVEEDLEDEMLNDQDKPNNSRIEIPIFRTEQGRYLADALGDPLIKGLTEIAEKRPPDPISYLATYLQNFAKTIGTNPEPRNDTPASGARHQQGQPLSSSRSGMARIEPSFDEYPPPPTTQAQPGGSREDFLSSPEGDDLGTIIENRDEHGQSMLHFACARPHGRNALLNLIEESQINITYRDELYRTARDVSLQASQPGNAKEIDRYVLSVAARGELSALQDMVEGGYDHILDVVDDQGLGIEEFVRSRGHLDLAKFLETIQQFEETREDLHHAIRAGDMDKVQELTSMADATRLIRAKNYYGRTALHICVLKENEAIVDYLTDSCRSALRLGDNLERTPLHYAMGINAVEKISRILIRKGAKRIVKDLKGRQPSYYFMNKADILRLQEEEDEVEEH